MSEFIYSGPQSAVSFGAGAGLGGPRQTSSTGAEVILRTGRTVSLPDDNPWVQKMVAQGHLTPIANESARGAARSETALNVSSAQPTSAATRQHKKEA